ncbi:MAG: hypothetical protein Kow00121_59830 [Elainellaceae cyanobacterium]
MVTSSTLNLWGNPAADAPYWRYQQLDSSCSVVAQASVYHSITGQYVSEEEGCQIAASQGWFTAEEGTPTEEAGSLLNHLGVSIYRTYGATIDDLKTTLENNKKVLVSLDAYEIWEPIRDELGMPVEQADGGHAVWVTGIEQELDGSYRVVLNDSGIPDGQQFTVDYEDFANAWQDRDFRLIVADSSIANSSLVGNQENDEMLGNSYANWFTGNAGNDTLIGKAASDTLIGGLGNDLLIGGEVINSGGVARVIDNDVDVMAGGSGGDIFALARGQGRERITDFQNQIDSLGLTAEIKYGQLDFTQRGKNTIVSLGNDQLAVLQGVQVNQLSRSDFTTVWA